MFPIALALSFGSRSLTLKLVYFGTALLIVGGIVVTFSRGGFLALMFARVMLLWKLVRNARWLLAPVALALVVLFVLFAPGGYKQRLSTRDDDLAMARFDDLKRSLFVASRHPVFGVGMDNYILFSNANKVTHNAYTQVAAEIGRRGAGVLHSIYGRAVQGPSENRAAELWKQVRTPVLLCRNGVTGQLGRLHGGQLFRVGGLPVVHLLPGCIRRLPEAYL